VNRANKTTQPLILPALAAWRATLLVVAFLVLGTTSNPVMARVHRKLVLGGKDHRARNLAFSRDGKRLVSHHSGYPRSIAVWDTEAGVLLTTIKELPDYDYFHGITSDAKVAVLGDSSGKASKLFVLNLENGTVAREVQLRQLDRGYAQLVLSPDCSVAACTGYTPTCRAYTTIHLVNMNTGETIRQQVAFDDGQHDITSLALSSDANTLASACSKTTKIWDMATLKLTQEITGDCGYGAISFSASGKTLITDNHSPIRMWHVSSGALLATLAKGDQGKFTASADDVDRIAARRHAEMYFWDFDAENIPEPPHTQLNGNALAQLTQLNQPQPDISVSIPPVARFPGTFKFDCVALSPDGKTVALADYEGAVRLYDWDDVRVGMMDRPLHTLELDQLDNKVDSVSLAFSPQANTIASGNDDGTISLIEASTRQVHRVLRGAEEGRIESIVFSPQGALLAFYSDDDNQIRIGDVNTGQPVASAEYHCDDPHFRFSPDGRHLAWTKPGYQGGFHLLEIQSGRQSVVPLACRKVGSFLTVVDANSNRFAFTPDGRTVVFASLKLGYGRNTGRGYPHVYNCCAALDLNSGSFRILGKRGESDRGIDNRHTSLVILPDGATAVAGVWRTDESESGHFIEVIEMQTGRIRQTLKGHASPISAVACSPDGAILASAGDDEQDNGAIRLWDARTGVLLGVFNTGEYSPHSLSFSPDGKTLISARGEYIQFWHPEVFHHVSYSGDTSLDDAATLGRALKAKGYLEDSLNTEFHLRTAGARSTLAVSLPDKALQNQRILAGLADDLGAILSRERFGDALTVHFCDGEFAIMKTTAVELQSAPEPPVQAPSNDSTCAPSSTLPHTPSEESDAAENAASGVLQVQDAQRIQGRWRVTRMQRAGRDVAVSDAQSYTFSAGKLIVRNSDYSSTTMTYVLSDTVSPAQLDLTWTSQNQQQVSPMIYSLDNDTLILCYAPPGDPRPSQFRTPYGSRLTLMAFERVSP